MEQHTHYTAVATSLAMTMMFMTSVHDRLQVDTSAPIWSVREGKGGEGGGGEGRGGGGEHYS